MPRSLYGRPKGARVTAAAAILVLTLGCACQGASRPSESSSSAGGSGAGAAGLQAGVEGPLRVGFLVVDGVYNTELTAPYDVFQHTHHHLAGGPGMEVFTVSPDGEAVTTAEGLRLLPDHGFDDAPEIDVLVVPSAEGSRDRDLDNEALIQWVRRTGERASLLVSLCWGAFVLAEAGLLDGRSATTFPADYSLFSRRFPEVSLRVNVSFVHDGTALTSEGGIRSFDVALYLVDLIYGEEVARNIGRGLLIPWPPDPYTRPPFITNPGLAAKPTTG